MVLHVEEDVRVNVEGDAYCAVVKVFLRRSWMNSSRKEQCRGRGADVAQPNLKQRRLEAPLVYVGRVKDAYQSL